ncbi:hypothetical protein EV714DRAFT_284362 [Schizophyllum commune]
MPPKRAAQKQHTKPGKPRKKRNTRVTSQYSDRPTRSPMTPEDLQHLRERMVEQLKGREPRFFQFRLAQAQEEGQDAVCQAATGQGKTGAAAAPFALERNATKTTLMISPLIVLQNEMVKTFQDEFGLPAVAISSAVDLTDGLFREIVAGKYRIVLLSPEMLLSHRFIERVLRKPAFRSRVYSIFVDEAHCISHWGADFRKEYSRIGTVRPLLPPDVPVIAVSATLTRRVTRSIVDTLQLNRSKERRYLHLNMGNDRRNVSLIVRPILNAMNSYTDLDFVIPEKLSSARDIPKTWIYVDSIKTGNEIVHHLQQLVPEPLREVIRPFNAILSQEYREQAMKKFQSGDIRVLVCTDAAGMGCNVPDIHFMQRAGRAARALEAGYAIMLVEPAAYTVFLDAEVGRDKASSERVRGKQASKSHLSKKEQTAYARAHGRYRGARSGTADDFPPMSKWQQSVIEEDDETEGVYHFVQSRRCRREILCEVFDDKKADVPCCDVCDKSLLSLARPGKNKKDAPRPRLAFEKEGSHALWILLDDWRDAFVRADVSWQAMGPECVLSNDIMDRISRLKHDKFSQHLRKLLESEWFLWKDHGERLIDHILSSFPHPATAGASATPQREASAGGSPPQEPPIASEAFNDARGSSGRTNEVEDSMAGRIVSQASQAVRASAPLTSTPAPTRSEVEQHRRPPSMTPTPNSARITSSLLRPPPSTLCATTPTPVNQPHRHATYTSNTPIPTQASRALAALAPQNPNPTPPQHQPHSGLPSRLTTPWAPRPHSWDAGPPPQSLATDGLSRSSLQTPHQVEGPRMALHPYSSSARPSPMPYQHASYRTPHHLQQTGPTTPFAQSVHGARAASSSSAVVSAASWMPPQSSTTQPTPVGPPTSRPLFRQQEYVPDAFEALRGDLMRLTAPCSAIMRGGSCRVGRVTSPALLLVVHRYEDGTVRPAGVLRKAEVIFILVFY